MSISRVQIQLAAFTLLALSSFRCGFAQHVDPVIEMPLPTANGPVIRINQGQVRGVVANGIATYKGLPFAAPPVGELRWRAPRQPDKWLGVRAANASGRSCAQGEDCLYLNIYAPADSNAGAKLPVLFWMHGGSFLFGSGSSYDGTQFARQGVLVVTINYRLGRAGWFAHPALRAEKSPDLLGNYGLMDQIAALEWAKHNIGAFGGDAGNITIAGESAGAICVNYLMLAPQARGLFNKAVAESGFARLQAKPIDAVAELDADWAEKAGVKGADAAAARALRALPWAVISRGNPAIGAADQILPMADGKLITGSAAEGFARGSEAHIPYLLGGNSDEASLTRRGLNAAERLAAIQQQRVQFLGAFDSESGNDAQRIVARFITDSLVSEPDRELARLHSQHRNPTYLYHFSYVPAALRSTLFGLPHGGELPYVWNVPRAGGLGTTTSFDAAGQAVALAANRYWAAFATTGTPDSAGGPLWPRFDPDESLLEFPDSGIPMVQTHFHQARLDWVEKNRQRGN